MLRPSTLVSAFLFLACHAAPPDEVAARGACHPACPGAESGAIVDAGDALHAELARASDARPPSSAAYLCPMHPWIGADAPEECSECGMRLVERARVLEHDHAK